MGVRCRHLLSALCAAALLVACGGGGGDGNTPPKASFSRVVTIGDSLADVGTFGMKFTIRNADTGGWFPVYPELVAAELGSTQCPYHRATAQSTFITDAACTNFAVGGGRVRNTAVQGGTDAPQHIARQLATAVGALGGYRSTDLVLIDGGGNDAADLVMAYLAPAALRDFLLRGIDAATLDPLLAQPDGPATAAGLYMERLADTMFAAIEFNVLNQGATHVAVLDIPDITRTPRLQAVLGTVAATLGANAAAELQGVIRQWIQAYNARLHARAGLDDRVVVVPFYDDLTAELTFPGLHGLTNVTQAVCPATGVDGNGLPTHDFQTCTSAALDAAPPQGLGAGWWTTWAFADGFHPTPRGHRMLAANVQRALAAAGW